MDKKVIVIGAVSQDGVYGKGDSIPWKISEEMHHFKEQTTGHTVVMGKGTWESIPEKFRPLPNRENMVVTNTPEYKAKGALVCNSIETAIASAVTEKIFLIGGHDIWYYGMLIADEALITEVRKDFWTNSDDERMAPQLLAPKPEWRMSLASSDERAGSIPFVIHHWVKGLKRGTLSTPQEEGHRE
jgi:dihydrofolate reductase